MVPIPQIDTSLAEQIDSLVRPFSNAVSAIVFYSIPIGDTNLPIVVVWLIAAAVILTIAMRFVNLTGFSHALQLLRQRSDGPGEIHAFDALSAALSGTVGLGNIASVPVAIALGGPGAVFWMIIAGFFGMTSKFAECAMAVKYRKHGANGRILGGPMYYIEAELTRRNMPAIGKAAGIFFAVMCIGASISVFQVNQAHAQFANVTGIHAPLLFGIVIASLTAIVILGGIKQIARVTRLLVPFMAGIYLLAGIFILLMHLDAIAPAIGLVITEAFRPEAAGGGIIGAMINGIQRATFSSEAGVGSAAIAHAAVRTKEPMTEGYVALLEPFIDTVVVCSLTALVILVTGAYEPFLYAPRSEIVGIEITSAAFTSSFSWYGYILLISVLLFAFSTLAAWAYYGSQAAAYLFGDTALVDRSFKLILCAILSTGAAIHLSSILDFIDSMLFAMAVPNIIVLYLLLPEIRKDHRAYIAQHRPTFASTNSKPGGAP